MHRLNKARLGWLTTIALVSAVSTATANQPSTRTMSPIVSSAWLRDNINRTNLVVLDVRPNERYQEGHIPKAVSAPFQTPVSAWITIKDDLLLEVPSQDELFATIGSLGISQSSWVVVVSAPNPGEPAAYGYAAATRVADTLIYAGVVNASILDGGFLRWVADAGIVTKDVPTVTPVKYSAQVRSSMFISTQYVKDHIGRATIIDARGADVYYGETIEPFANKAGHIATAKSLPTPWLWNADGLFKDSTVLGKMALGAIGWYGAREIIVYCGVGGYASTSWFVLSQVLGYPHVKFYDGSAQEWVRTEPMVPYIWQ
ncbi:MAG TPA: rhodanese-like domain-containing protein [Polyangiaceae bacterium]